MWKSIGHFMEHTIRLNHDYQFTLKLGPSRLMPSNTENPIDDLFDNLLGGKLGYALLEPLQNLKLTLSDVKSISKLNIPLKSLS